MTLDWMESKSIAPMLLSESKTPFDSPDYIYELKLDGVRCVAYLQANVTTLRNKRNKDVTSLYPELITLYQYAKKPCILDGELVCIVDGKPNFAALQRRTLMNDPFQIDLAAKLSPVQFIAYDLLYYEDAPTTSLPLLKRKGLLQSNIKQSPFIRIVPYIENQGVSFYQLTKQQGLEGIVAKKKNSLYIPGTRSKDWLKMKALLEEDLFIIGLVKNEQQQVKSLLLADYDSNHQLRFRGEVSGVSKEEQRLMEQYVSSITLSSPLFLKKEEKGEYIIWLKPKFTAVVNYMQLTPSGSMRQPSLKEVRID